MATPDKKRGSLHSQMGRPAKTPLQSFHPRIIEQIKNWRVQHPGWGPKTLFHELENNGRFDDLALPKPSTIAILLKEQGLTRPYSQHRPMPGPKSVPPENAHDLWQLDAQGGFQLLPIGPMTMINIKDVHSLIYCMAFPNRKKHLTGHSKRTDYQCALRLAFMEFGLPKGIQTDHESIFYENKTNSPFPTVLHLWLISLGITQIFSRIHQPTDQSLVERMHQTIEKQAIQGMTYSTWEAFFDYCQQRRRVLNQTYPCASLNNKAPLQALPQARHSQRFYHLQLEEQMMDLTRVYAFLAQGEWFRWTGNDSRIVSVGGYKYYVPQFKPRTQVRITFDSETQELLFHNDKELVLEKHPIRGITKLDLMGPLYWKISNVQLELPFSWDVQKLNTTFLDNA